MILVWKVGSRCFWWEKIVWKTWSEVRKGRDFVQHIYTLRPEVSFEAWEKQESVVLWDSLPQKNDTYWKFPGQKESDERLEAQASFPRWGPIARSNRCESTSVSGIHERCEIDWRTTLKLLGGEELVRGLVTPEGPWMTCCPRANRWPSLNCGWSLPGPVLRTGMGHELPVCQRHI